MDENKLRRYLGQLGDEAVPAPVFDDIRLQKTAVVIEPSPKPRRAMTIGLAASVTILAAIGVAVLANQEPDSNVVINAAGPATTESSAPPTTAVPVTAIADAMPTINIVSERPQISYDVLVSQSSSIFVGTFEGIAETVQVLPPNEEDLVILAEDELRWVEFRGYGFDVHEVIKGPEFDNDLSLVEPSFQLNRSGERLEIIDFGESAVPQMVPGQTYLIFAGGVGEGTNGHILLTSAVPGVFDLSEAGQISMIEGWYFPFEIAGDLDYLRGLVMTSSFMPPTDVEIRDYQVQRDRLYEIFERLGFDTSSGDHPGQLSDSILADPGDGDFIQVLTVGLQTEPVGEFESLGPVELGGLEFSGISRGSLGDGVWFRCEGLLVELIGLPNLEGFSQTVATLHSEFCAVSAS